MDHEGQVGTGGRAGRREWVGLAALALPTLLVSIDISVLLLAVPHLSSSLGASTVEQLWITDIYGFMIAGFLVTMGTLGDRMGRRKLLLIGCAAFGAASTLAAYSWSPETLIAARALMGVAGATVAPSALALISNMFASAQQRSMAIGIWLVCFMGGMALGPVVGGLLLENFWWGSVFLLGVPVMVLLLLVGPVLLPEHRGATVGRLDLVSVGLSLAAVLPVIYGLKEIAKHGVQSVPAVSVTVGLVLGVAFVFRQRKLVHPLLDLTLFRARAFSAALGSMLVCVMVTGPMMLFNTQFFQLVAGLSPLRAGLWMLPAVGGSIAGFVLSPLIARRIRPAYAIGFGLVLAVAGLLIIAQVTVSTGLTALVAGFALVSLGCGPLVTLGTDLVVGSADIDKAGSAASMSETSGEFGFALGIAGLGSIGAAVYRGHLADALPPGLSTESAGAAVDSLATATRLAAELPGPLGQALVSAAQDAFTSGIRVAALVSALALSAVAVVAVTMLRHVGPSTAPEVAAAEEQGGKVGSGSRPEPARLA